MAKRTAVKKKMVRKVAKRAVVRRAVRKAAASRRPAHKAAASSRPAKMPSRNGVITHTELASLDPTATKDWCASVLGWKFGPSMPTPAGPYHMWQFANQTGGGIRANNPPEQPGSIPYCEVNDMDAVYSKALDAGANEMLAPQALPDGMGRIAIVAAPGGVAIGFWSSK